MKKPYEMLMIIDPKLEKEKRESKVEDVKKVIEELGGEIESEDIWGMKKFAYEIGKREEGYYVNFDLLIPSEKIDEIKNKFKLTKELLRFLILKKE